ncbi:MAG: hypothetical protein FGM29_02510 [Actinobacteria bacterium]|nr:hypothetical protein [Actinomycetota bacterium]
MSRTMQRPSARVEASRSEVAEPSSTPSVVSLSAPKRKRPSWVLAGMLLVGLSALMAAWVFNATSETMSVMVAARDISPGEVVDSSDLRVVEMGRTDGLRAIQPSQQDLIIGRAARGPIPAGTVLNTDLFSEKGKVIPPGFVVVGASVEAGAAPTSGLSAGDQVDLLGVVKGTSAAPADAAVASVLGSGTVWSVERVGSGSTSTKLWVSVLVPADVQAAVAQAASDGRLRLTLVGADG